MTLCYTVGKLESTLNHQTRTSSVTLTRTQVGPTCTCTCTCMSELWRRVASTQVEGRVNKKGHPRHLGRRPQPSVRPNINCCRIQKTPLKLTANQNINAISDIQI